MMFCCHLCAFCPNVLFPTCYLCSYDHAGKMDCSTVKDKGSKNVIVIIMFHWMHTKSFSGHYDDAMLVVMSNTFGSLHLRKIVE